MTELIITIVSLSLLLISLLAYCIVTHRRHELDLDEWRDGACDLYKRLAASEENYVALLEKYSSSIDKHSAAYDDILNRCKKLELELDAKDLEIDRLNTILNLQRCEPDEEKEVKEVKEEN